MAISTLYSTGNSLLIEAWNLLLVVTELIVCRLEIFIKALPLFLISALVFVTDGLVQRDIRKFQATRESTLFFHRTKLLMGFCFFVPLFIYLVLPFFISPILFFALQSLMLGIAVKLTATYFKKYI